jgi:hypothetical protein
VLSSMRQRFAGSGIFSFARPGRWALFLLVLLLVLNVCGLLVYRASHPNQSPSLQLWSYLESDTFKLVTGSLVLPLLVFLVEGRFDIAETIRKSREERAQRLRDERQKWRLEAVDKTMDTWNDLYALATEVAYWNPQTDLRDLLVRSTNFANHAEEIVASWRVRFPSLHEAVDIIAVLLPLMNTLNVCIHSVAAHLHENDDRQEQAELQATLRVIQDGTKNAIRYPLMDILRCGLELETLRDTRRLGGPEEQDVAAEESRLLTEIHENAELLGTWVKALVQRDATAEPMPILDSAEAESFREVYRRARDWLLEHPGRTLVEYEDYNTFRDRFEAIPHSQVMRAYPVAYSKQWLREFSDWFALAAYHIELEDRTKLPTWLQESESGSS